MNREVKKKKRKRKRILKLFFIVIILLGVGAGYTFYQYYQGLKHAGESAFKDNNYAEEFEGKVDKHGNVNVLILGVDTRGEEKSRSDTIMVAQYNPENHQAKLVSIMRDIYVEIPGYQNYKINTAYFLGGPELLRQTLKQNFDIDVQYYALVDFKGFTKIVDTLSPDGIEIDVEKPMSAFIGVSLEPGLQKLDGKELLGYARFRHDAEGDFGRVRRQQIVIDALKDELISINGFTKLPKLVGTIRPYIDTNMDTMDSIALIKDFILNPPEQIETLRIPVDHSYSDGYYEHAGAVLDIDFDKNTEAIQSFLNGKPKVEESTTEETNTDAQN